MFFHFSQLEGWSAEDIKAGDDVEYTIRRDRNDPNKLSAVQASGVGCKYSGVGCEMCGVCGVHHPPRPQRPQQAVGGAGEFDVWLGAAQVGLACRCMESQKAVLLDG